MDVLRERIDLCAAPNGLKEFLWYTFYYKSSSKQAITCNNLNTEWQNIQICKYTQTRQFVDTTQTSF